MRNFLSSSLAVCSEVFARRGPVCAVRKTSRQARRASFIVFYLINIKSRGAFCELRFKSRGEVSALRRSMCAGRMIVSRLDWFALYSLFCLLKSKKRSSLRAFCFKKYRCET